MDRSTRDPANLRGSTMSHDEKNLFEDVVTPTEATRTVSIANVTSFISEKLLDWGVEERGVYRILTLRSGRP